MYSNEDLRTLNLKCFFVKRVGILLCKIVDVKYFQCENYGDKRSLWIILVIIKKKTKRKD